jgi:alkyl sulfatase BDS1-like metallo-beta-lactamase superfamily hydrolase
LKHLINLGGKIMKNKKNMLKAVILSLALSVSLYAAENPKEATGFTQNVNNQVLRELPFSNTQDFEDAKKGFIEELPDLLIKGSDGHNVWDLKSFEFLNGKSAPETVNPSLWRVAQINNINGLFKVTDKVYQIRGFDLSNMTIIEGKSGLIIIDPLVTSETSKAGLDLYYKNRPKKPVKAVIYSHSHVDHYGGVKGVITEDEVKSGKVKVYAPNGFLEEAVKENVYAGNAMSRRSIYMYGSMLEKGEKGQVDAGLGKTNSIGTIGLIAPTDLIMKTGDSKIIDGVKIEFMMAPGTEAPAEMIMYFPEFKMINSAEDATHTLHNLYTLRGAQVRDAVNWWKTLDLMQAAYGDKTEIIIAQHHWPKWGKENINSYLEKQRDGYKYIHDQTLNLANKGYTMNEIAETIKFPDGLAQEWSLRGYYGSISHNTKAVYQKYLGWYDSNPANLNPLPPVEEAKRYVEFMGGTNAVIKKAKEYYNRGEYRWVAEVMNKVVFADPNNQEAKNLQADTLEQLGYQSENATWRNEYLMGAYELRNGTAKVPEGFGTGTPDTIKAMTVDMYLDYMGIRLDGEKANGKIMKINWDIPDIKEKYTVSLENSVLTYRKVNSFAKNADITLTLDKSVLDAIQTKETTLDKEISSGKVKISGDVNKFKEYMGLFDNFTADFNIVTP